MVNKHRMVWGDSKALQTWGQEFDPWHCPTSLNVVLQHFLWIPSSTQVFENPHSKG